MPNDTLLNEHLPELMPGIRVSANRLQAMSTDGKLPLSLLLLNIAALYVVVCELRMPHDPTVATGFLVAVLAVLIWRSLNSPEKPSILWRTVSWWIPCAGILAIVLIKRYDLSWIFSVAVGCGIALPFLKGAFFYAFNDYLEIDKVNQEFRLYRSKLFRKVLFSIPLHQAEYTLEHSLSPMNTASQLVLYISVTQQGQEYSKKISLTGLYLGIITRKTWAEERSKWEQKYGEVMEQLVGELKDWANSQSVL